LCIQFASRIGRWSNDLVSVLSINCLQNYVCMYVCMYLFIYLFIYLHYLFIYLTSLISVAIIDEFFHRRHVGCSNWVRVSVICFCFLCKPRVAETPRMFTNIILVSM